MLSRTVDIGPELVATRVGMRPDAPECDRMQKMTTARRDCTHASNTQCAPANADYLDANEVSPVARYGSLKLGA